VAIHGANNATRIKIATMTIPMMPNLLIKQFVGLAASLLLLNPPTSWQLALNYDTRILGSSQRYRTSVSVFAMM